MGFSGEIFLVVGRVVVVGLGRLGLRRASMSRPESGLISFRARLRLRSLGGTGFGGG